MFGNGDVPYRLTTDIYNFLSQLLRLRGLKHLHKNIKQLLEEQK